MIWRREILQECVSNETCLPVGLSGPVDGDTLVAKVRGDGREYTLNLYPNKSGTAFAYRATVQTEKDEWIEIRVPLDEFEATSFGQIVREAGAVKPEEISSVGFLLGDKKAGPFKMEIEWIKVERSVSAE